jgi:putative transposase
MKKKSFQTEYKEFLKKFEIDYKEEYLFDWMD